MPEVGGGSIESLCDSRLLRSRPERSSGMEPPHPPRKQAIIVGTRRAVSVKFAVILVDTAQPVPAVGFKPCILQNKVVELIYRFKEDETQ